jgi:hypothetical protein
MLISDIIETKISGSTAQFLLQLNSMRTDSSKLAIGVGHDYEFYNVDVSFNIRPMNNTHVILQSFKSDNPRSGEGSQALKTLCTFADRFGVTILLDASPYSTQAVDPAIPRKSLINWYRRFGFRIVSGTEMIREPQNVVSVSESISDWGTNWVHFTKHPMLTIHPRGSHQDPAGIYFFPASITPAAEMWRTMPYKFTASIKPGAPILDIAQITEDQIHQMINAAGPEPQAQFADYLTRYPPADMPKMFHLAWGILQQYYGFGLKKARQYASFNAMLRSLGWQAIFDDTGSIHSGEKEQLLVLDPRILTNIRMEQKSGSGFPVVQQIVQEIETLGRQYGTVTRTQITKPNSQTSSWDGNGNLLNCRVEIHNPNDENNYVTILVYIRKDYPDRVSASIQYSNPSLGYGSGIEYSISKQAYTNHSGIADLQRDLTKIFTPEPHK